MPCFVHACTAAAVQQHERVCCCCFLSGPAPACAQWVLQYHMRSEPRDGTRGVRAAWWCHACPLAGLAVHDLPAVLRPPPRPGMRLPPLPPAPNRHAPPPPPPPPSPPLQSLQSPTYLTGSTSRDAFLVGAGPVLPSEGRCNVLAGRRESGGATCRARRGSFNSPPSCPAPGLRVASPPRSPPPCHACLLLAMPVSATTGGWRGHRSSGQRRGGQPAARSRHRQQRQQHQ